MKCKIRIIKPWNIFHFDFDSQYDMASTFVRIQEHYESPFYKHREQAFTMEEYMDWYVKKNGFWDYFDAWVGFNIPDGSIKSFYNIFVASLRKKEMWVLNRLKKFKSWPGIYSTEPWCIICTCEQDKSTLKHELAHALFYLIPEYAKEVRECIKQYKIKRFRNELLLKGYSESVLIDEINAYAITGWLDEKPSKEMLRLADELSKIARKYFNGKI